MNLSILLDEISSDPHAAVYIGTKDLNLRSYELRFLPGGRAPDISEATAEQLLQLKEEYGVTYCSIAAGLFKCAPEKEEMDRQLHDRLEAAIRLAHRLDIKLITGFALIDHHKHRPQELFKTAVPYFKRVCSRAAEEGLTFAVETEFMTGCERAADAERLISEVGPGLKVNWDPANAWVAGECPLEGYDFIRGHIASVHVKDAFTRDWRSSNPFVALGEGQVPWQPLLHMLVRDTVTPVPNLTIETHCEPLIPHTLKSVAALRSMLQASGYREEKRS